MPGGGDAGGHVVAVGTPRVAATASFTAQAKAHGRRQDVPSKVIVAEAVQPLNTASVASGPPRSLAFRSVHSREEDCKKTVPFAAIIVSRCIGSRRREPSRRSLSVARRNCSFSQRSEPPGTSQPLADHFLTGSRRPPPSGTGGDVKGLEHQCQYCDSQNLNCSSHRRLQGNPSFTDRVDLRGAHNRSLLKGVHYGGAHLGSGRGSHGQKTPLVQTHITTGAARNVAR